MDMMGCFTRGSTCPLRLEENLVEFMGKCARTYIEIVHINVYDLYFDAGFLHNIRITLYHSYACVKA